MTARFDTINRLDQVGPDERARSPARSKANPRRTTLKVAMNELGGYRNTVAVALTGSRHRCQGRGRRGGVLAMRARTNPSDFESVDARVIERTDQPGPRHRTRLATAVSGGLTVKDRRRAQGRPGVQRCQLVHTRPLLASIPGLYGLSGMARRPGSPYGVYKPGHRAGRPRSPVRAHAHARRLDQDDRQVDSAAPASGDPDPRPSPPPLEPHLAEGRYTYDPAAATVDVPLGRVVGTRSGDKGGNANLGVFVRSPEAWAWLDSWLTVERLGELLPEAGALEITRYRFPNVLALNFVIHGLLQEGVAASTRQDGQAKAVGEWLRSRIAPIPATLLADD